MGRQAGRQAFIFFFSMNMSKIENKTQTIEAVQSQLQSDQMQPGPNFN